MSDHFWFRFWQVRDSYALIFFITCGTIIWLKVLKQAKEEKTFAYYPILFTWLAGALLYKLVRLLGSNATVKKDKQRRIGIWILLITSYVIAFCLPPLVIKLGAIGNTKLGNCPYFVVPYFIVDLLAPFLISAFILYKCREKRFIIPTVVLLVAAPPVRIVYGEIMVAVYAAS